MKTKISVIITISILVLTAAFAVGSELPKMNISQIGEEAALLNFESKTPCNFEVTITDENDDIVFFHKSKRQNTSYSEKFFFPGLQDGTYRVCFNYGNQSLNNKIIVANNNITTEEATHLYEPFMKLDENRLKVSFLNTTQKHVFLNIYHEGEHIYGYNLGKNLAIHRSYNLSTLRKGEYRVILSEDSGEHIYTVKK
ncbi:hypothetical protein [uncultured Draconibacterium sp.]|uniref:hypothetical protein n=1 Tax=uncultured Draconibacterium sp. TaxID=1573823 RepID=UPI0025FA4EE8|nr:hypothetical protein [uncultured Draconibacterium sp.]